MKVESLDGKTDPYGVRDMNLIKQKGTTDSPGGSAAVVWTFIPFYARANRGKGAMIVHVPTEPRAHASLEAYAVPSASYTYNGDSVYHLNDGTDNAAKRWTSYKSATSVISDPWVQYDFSYEVDVSACLIRWYRDSSGVSLPDSFTIYYRDTATGKYRPVTGQDSDRITYGSVNEYTFREVRTDSIRIEMKNAVSGKAVGIIEWKLVGSVVSVPLETDAPPETGTEPASSASGTAAVPSDGAPGSERKKTAAAIAASAAAAAAAVGVTLAVTAKKKRAKKKD